MIPATKLPHEIQNVSVDEWRELCEFANTLNGILQRKPASVKLAHNLTAGSILNAYREGDISFERATEELEAIASKKAAAIQAELIAALQGLMEEKPWCDGRWFCHWCGVRGAENYEDHYHAPDCAWLKAKAALAKAKGIK